MKVLKYDNVLVPIRDTRCATCGARRTAFRSLCVLCGCVNS